VFKVTPGGTFTALHRLDPMSEGAFVRLMQATDGLLRNHGAGRPA
jgi:hypothetical protein